MTEISVDELSLAEAAKALVDGATTSLALTHAYRARITAIDPALGSVLSLNPQADAAAQAADARRRAKTSLGPLDGIPLLIKDNIDVAGIANTAGSFALIDNVPARDAPSAKRLTDAGAVVLGKTNLSAWANIRSRHSTSGWSAVGGLTRNPYAHDRSASGSSSGSAVAVATSLAAAAIGTETDGSITWPAAVCGIVGLKPTVGLVSRTGVVPISHSQDTPGPMARSVADVAMVLNVMAGSDASDATTVEADRRRTDYLKALSGASLKGARLGVMRCFRNFTPETLAAFDAALSALQGQGAVLVDIPEFDMAPVQRDLLTVLLTEFKFGLNRYLATANPNVKTRSLADVIAFNRRDPRELAHFGQDFFEIAANTAGIDDPSYLAAHQHSRRMAGPEGIDRLLCAYRVSALLAPTNDPAWPIDLARGDKPGGFTTTLPAVAGYPHLTVPMGLVEGLPVGLSFMGEAWSEPTLLALGYAFEQATRARRPPALTPSLR